MNRKLIGLLICFIALFGFSFITSVKADNYAEISFSGGKCIKTDIWQEKAMTNYTLNQEKGLFELSGEQYSEENAENTHIYYVTSEDGKLLGAFVPNYKSAIANEAIKDELWKKGLMTTLSCEETFYMTKTIEGNPPTEESVLEGIDPEEDDDEKKDDDQGGNKDEDEDKDKDPSQLEKGDGVVPKEKAPNTASPAAITAIVASIILIGVAVYSYIVRVRPDLLKKIK